MFFNIGLDRLDNYPIHYQHGNLIINLDTGWTETVDTHNNKIFYKGYVDNGKIEDYIQSIAEQEDPLYTGNFCLIKCFDQGVTLKTDRYRSFPIWYNKEHGVNNLIQYNETIWTDSFITLTFNLTKIESKIDLIGPIKTATLSFDEVVEYVDKILTDKISTFAQTLKQPIKIFLSGGIDTTTLFSYFYKLKIPYEIISCYHTDLDYFYLKNHGDLSKFWGYRQFHYWDESVILLSGTPGDEFTVRSPTTVNMILRYYNTSVDKLLPKYTNSLHYQYFSNYSALWESQKNLNYTSLEEVIISCSNIILNDWQHWHLGKTISYTPFRDLRFFQTIARLEFDDLVEHVMNSSIQKELITRNNPELLQILSTNKNSNNYMENVTKKAMLNLTNH
jgi:hypothetical protein